ncbi:MAG TPA: Flp pilus assembly protein CpaB [Symbiobacteriaceae bacterium]|nr:Flp pilus assembly protein CpaB [Symbiobacteriaceae bacterium]
MQPSRLPLKLALAAFGLALVSGAWVWGKVIRTVPALVAVHDVAPGTEVTGEMVRVIRVPAGGTPPLALYGPGQVTGMYASVPIFQDHILTARHLTADPPAADAMSTLAPGQRVVSVPVRPEAVLGGALKPGDLVDVAAAWPGPEGKPGPVEVLVTGVRVADLRNSAGRSIDKLSDDAIDGAVPTAALLVVDAAQARTLVGAVESRATIYLWLVGRDGT